MGSCHSGDHNAEGHIHTDITACNIEHNRSNALERSVIDYWGLKHALLDPNPRPMLLQWFGKFARRFMNRLPKKRSLSSITIFFIMPLGLL